MRVALTHYMEHFYADVPKLKKPEVTIGIDEGELPHTRWGGLMRVSPCEPVHALCPALSLHMPCAWHELQLMFVRYVKASSTLDTMCGRCSSELLRLACTRDIAAGATQECIQQ